MTVKTGQSWAGAFVTLDATGALAAGTPSGVLYVDGTADAATVTITGSNPYKWSVTLPSLTAGQRVDMYITGTIDSIATAGFVASEQADTALASEVKTDTAAILADTGTDGVKIASAQTVATVTNLTNLPTMPADWLTADGVKADAVTKISFGVWTDTNTFAIDEKGFWLQTLYDDLVNGGRLDLLIDSIIAHLVGIKGAGWTNQTLVKIVTDIAAISAGSGATAQEVWEYATRVLTAGTNIDLSALATADNLAAVKSVADDILVDTGTTLDTLVKDIPTNAELATALGTADDAVLAAVAAAKSVIDNIHDTDLPAVKAETALIVEDTGTTLPATLATLAGYTDGIAGDVWSYAKRTLTHPSVSAEEPEDSNTLILYRDADIAIELTDLTIPAGAKKYIFTIKDNLDSGDDQAVLQASYAIDGSEVETNTLVYINSAAAPVLTNPVTFTLTDTNITIDLTAEAAALLPRYERGYLNWDLKLVTDASVTIVLQGLAQIIGTSTRAIE